MSAHTCILKREEKDALRNDEAYNVHLLWILRHWYRYTIEQSLEKQNYEENENLFYLKSSVSIISRYFYLLFIDTWNKNKKHEKE